MLDWWHRYGRHDLPWQKPRTPYRVWVSEIMLQQTRVETVIDYFNRFMARLPTLAALAAAEADAVLALWSGLGYYARARHLHAAARLCVERHGQTLPADRQALEALPGIGRSTAGAILALGFDRPAAILDGNIKRLLARHAGIEAWPGHSRVQKQLWQIAESRLPPKHAAAYAQAMMDLGATVCTRKTPVCERCPIAEDCQARLSGQVQRLPATRPRRVPAQREAGYALIEDSTGRILLTRRPAHGIWGGLWCLPEDGRFTSTLQAAAKPAPASIVHSFTHCRLQMVFRRYLCPDPQRFGADEQAWRWLDAGQLAQVGLPQPIRRVLESLWCADQGSMSTNGLDARPPEST